MVPIFCAIYIKNWLTMKKSFFKFIVFVLFLVTFSSCGLLNKITNGNNEQTTTDVVSGQGMIMTSHEYTEYQLDSLCKADNLPRDFSDGWIRQSYIDYESGNSVVRYMYIKDLSKVYEMIYIVAPKGDMYVVHKRETKNE